MSNPLFDTLLAPHLGSDAPFLQLSLHETLAYGQFIDGVGRSVNALEEIGLVPGDRLAVRIDKSVAALELYAACLAAGIVYVPLSPTISPDKPRYVLRDSGASAFICSFADAAMAGSVATDLGIRLFTLSAQNTGSFAELVAAQTATFSPAVREEDDIAALPYVTGHAGRLRGAMVTHGNMIFNAKMLAKHWKINSSDRLLHVLPLFHAHGLFVAVNTALLTGAQMILIPRPGPHFLTEWLPKSTILMAVPQTYELLLRSPGFSRKTTENVRLFICGSAPLPAKTHDQFTEATGHDILDRYGTTEAGICTSQPLDQGSRRRGTVGRPLTGMNLRLVDPFAATPTPTGKTGVIEVRGPNLFKGYWQRQDETSAVLDEEGWYNTGDLARMDRDGFVKLMGKVSEIILSDDYRIYPEEIETLLETLPWVREAAIIGVPHPDQQRAVVAVLVVEQGQAADLEAMQRFVSAKLAKYKQPKAYITTAELPRDVMGKVQKDTLRARHAALFKDAASEKLKRA